MAEAPPAVLVHTPQGLAGRVLRDVAGFLFSFDPAAGADTAPALGMPLRARPYAHPVLHPVFQMNLPEGYVLEQLRQRLSKSTGMDPLLLLTHLALDLAGHRSFFAARQGLLDFGAQCDLPKARVAARLLELAQAALQTLDELAELVDRLPGLRPVIEAEARRFIASFTRLS